MDPIFSDSMDPMRIFSDSGDPIWVPKTSEKNPGKSKGKI